MSQDLFDKNQGPRDLFIDPSYGADSSKGDVQQDASRLGGISNSADAAAASIDDINAYRQAMKNFQPGPFAGTIGLPLAKAKYMLQEMGITDRDKKNEAYISSADAMEALSAKMQLNDASSLLKGQGQISDGEREIVKQMSPTLRTNPGATEMILAQKEMSAKRLVAREKFYRMYYHLNRTYAGASTQWQRFVQENPVINNDGTVNSSNADNFYSYLNPNSKK